MDTFSGKGDLHTIRPGNATVVERGSQIGAHQHFVVERFRLYLVYLTLPLALTDSAMLLAQPYLEEFLALRNLEKAVRACGLPSMMVSGQPQVDSLAAALKAIEEARSLADKRSIDSEG